MASLIFVLQSQDIRPSYSVLDDNANGTLTIQTLAPSLVSGASYAIFPDPKTGLGNLTAIDGGTGDEDGISDGIIKISQVPQGKYLINQVAMQPGFLSLLGSTTRNINPLDLNQNVVFIVIPVSTVSEGVATGQLATSITHHGTITIKTLQTSPPQIIVVSSTNSTAIKAAINSQSSVLLNASFAPLTTGSTIINVIGLENYSLPNSTNLVSIIPTIVANVSTTSGYVVATPPFSKIIPGQEMIIPVTNSLIPSFGGLKEIDVQSSPTAQPVGEKNTEWLVAEVDNKIPSSVGSNGIKDTPEFFVNVQHPFEESGSGFNWSDPANHAVPPLLTLVINKNPSDSIQKDSNDCPLVDAYTFTGKSWTSVGVREISSRSTSSSQCEIIVQSQHLSKFAFSLHHFSSLTLSGGPPSTVSTGLSQPPSYLAEASIQSSTTLSNNTPSPPVGLTTSASLSQINLRWTIPTSNGGSPITGYKIERSTNSGSTWYTIANTASTAIYSDAGLASGITYTYRVSAINAVGIGSPSNTAATTVSHPTTPTTTPSVPSEASLLQHIAQLNPLHRFSDYFTSWFGLH